MGTRRGAEGVPLNLTRLNPKIGLLAYAAVKTMSNFDAESFRFRLHPWFDRWVLGQLVPGDHMISSYGFANGCFKRVRQHGGKTFLSAGNSHPENFWAILEEEHKRWKCSDPPIARHHYERSKAMMADVDYVLSPSSFVSDSFLSRGFKPGQILRNIYPVNLSTFTPRATARPKGAPLRVICTGSLSLRKGTPYLLEAFRLVLKQVSGARLLLTRLVQDSVVPILRKYSDLPMDWAPGLPHAQLAERLRSADIFVLPSLEEGLARTTLEAMACGLPVVITKNTGTSDFVKNGVNGEIVPIRDPGAIAEAILKWHEKIIASPEPVKIDFDRTSISYDYFAKEFLTQLVDLALVARSTSASQREY
jgi:glycosyltransferase involved in cell wall biosynthesis